MNEIEKKILVIIPAYNEEQNIEKVLDDIRKNCHYVDIVVIDDGSSDSTARIATENKALVLSLPFNLGIGAAMQTGYKYAKDNGYDIAVQFDGDGQHRADQLDAIIKPVIDNDTDMAIGSRFLGDEKFRSGFARMAGIRILSSVISVLTGKRITDPTSGFRAVEYKVIGYYSDYYPDDYPEPEAIVILKKAGFRIMEVPTMMRKRQGGKTSITPVRSLYYMVKVLLAILIDLIKKF
jgi:glycosyltransferase involved in cell wall biosynthesis